MPNRRDRSQYFCKRLFGVLVQGLDFAAALEIARVDHAHGDEDEAAEVVGCEADGVEHGVDADAAVAAHEHDGRGQIGVGLAGGRLAGGGQLAERFVEPLQPLADLR